MKTLSTLALLTAAAASQAYTLDLQVGTGKPSAPHAGSANADNTSVVGIGFGTYLTENSHLGLNLSTRDIVNSDIFVDATARTAIVEYTYELNSTGGIKPFIGAGIGYAWLKNTDKATALASDVFAGVRFNITQSVDLTFTARAHQLYNVDFSQVNGESNRQINSFEAVAGLRFNF
jgi:opacity protein-like surface antigen